MKVTTLKIKKRTRSFDMIEKNFQALASSGNKKVVVSVSFVKGGEFIYMTIPTFIKLKQDKEEVIVLCKANITKPILISLLIGGSCPFSALLAGKIDVYVILLFASFIASFLFFLNRIIYTTRDYLTVELFRRKKQY